MATLPGRRASRLASKFAIMLAAGLMTVGGAQSETAPGPTPNATVAVDAKTEADNEALVEGPIYPRETVTDAGKVLVHMPQIESWKNFREMQGWSVVEVTPAGGDKTWIGSVKFAADTDINFDRRLVVMHDIEIIDRRFHDGVEPPESVKQIARDAISLKPRSVPLDVVVRALPEDFQVSSHRPGKPPELRNEPPRIFVSTTSARLMIVNGEPIKAPIADTQLEFVVNTNWDLFWHKGTERWYVRDEAAWQSARTLTDGSWQVVEQLPSGFDKLPNDENWTEVKVYLPAKAPAEPLPTLLVSLEPAELILLNGQPERAPIPEAGMEWITNTEADLFVYQGDYYYLVSGRWFTSGPIEGPWKPVTTLPENFGYIPETHEKGHVLVSVPGTDTNRAAAIEAQMPRTAEINLDAGSGVEVLYAGDPRFVPIEGTDMQRAANTSSQVILLDGRYYLCYNAVWFDSDQPTGPWQVTHGVPDAIYTIPASDPAHNVTYVYVYPEEQDEPRTTVTYAYTSGYYGTYYSSGYGSVWYGTGWYYPPYYYYYPGGYPAYWYYPPAYGYGAWYNPNTGTYGRGSVVYGPYGGVAAGGAYNPRTGTYARGWSAWDNDELARGGYAYNPRSNTYAAGNLYYDFDDNAGWSERYVQRGDRWAYGETEYDGNKARSEFETSRGVTGTSERTRNEDSITGSGTLQKGDRSATTTSRVDENSAQLNVQGDRGGSIDVSKDRGQAGRDVSVTGPGGGTASGESYATGGGGRRTELQGDAGGSATVQRRGGNVAYGGQSASGDLYAGANGSIYRKSSDGGWSSYNNGSWQSAERNRQQDRATARSNSSFNRQSLDRHRSARTGGMRSYNRGQFQRGSMGRARGGGRRR